MAAPAPAPAAQNENRIVELKKWQCVALWMYECSIENCAICKVNVMDLCIECASNKENATGDECNVAWGTCNHPYHMHCISRWLKTKQTCPMCNIEWEYQRVGAEHST